ncbi:MAG TPA: F0F1 ATP synthase subunit epsilon [Gammaproteobacteria bacterium]|jgi:F-type H+-transporting ATPase subunit epsilon|nr:F0F1 ATP synthase subunit epsilon [Gammaproteobacteria bacterium]
MAMTMHVDIVSAEQEIYSGTVEEVHAPAEMGSLGIMPRHSPLVARLKAGEVRVKPAGKDEMISIFVSGGIVEIQPHIVTVLADTGMRAGDLDEAAALEAKKRAEALLADKEGSVDFVKAKLELLSSIQQLDMIRKYRKKGR